MDAPGGLTRRRVLHIVRTVLRNLVLLAFCGTVAAIILMIIVVALSITELTFDPHGYGRIFGVVIALVLTPVALVLWGLYRFLR